jgi:hypothetical protein
MTAPDVFEGRCEALNDNGGVRAFSDHPFCFVLARQFVKVRQLCEQARQRGRWCRHERHECIVLIVARFFRNPASSPKAVPSLKSALQLERSQMSDMGFAVDLNQVEHRIDRGSGRQHGGDRGHNSAAGSDGE